MLNCVHSVRSGSKNRAGQPSNGSYGSRAESAHNAKLRVAAETATTAPYSPQFALRWSVNATQHLRVRACAHRQPKSSQRRGINAAEEGKLRQGKLNSARSPRNVAIVGFVAAALLGRQAHLAVRDQHSGALQRRLAATTRRSSRTLQLTRTVSSAARRSQTFRCVPRQCK